MILMTILCIYTLFTLCISYNQIQFIKKEKNKQAVILSKNDYINAANIAIENEKYKMFSNIYHLIINIAWLSFGFLYLKDFFIKETGVLNSILGLFLGSLLLLIISIILFVLPGILILKVEVEDKNALEFKKNWIKKGFHLILIFGSLLFCKKI